MSSSSQYTFSHPEQSLSKEHVAFLERFYQTSDDPQASRQYADVFVQDGELVMMGKKVNGQEEIYTLRTTMWNPVVSRAHNPIAVFPFSSPSASAEVEIMLHGTVSYTLNDGRKCEDVEWAARGILVDVVGETRWRRYQVYMDSAAMTPK